MSFLYHRTVRFQDTDAAGVVYFANVLSICHEAYEASLAAAAIDLKTFFRATDLAVPITHAQVDFLRPLFCGDRLTIRLTPHPITDSEFEITYTICADTDHQRPLSQAVTRHICIDPSIRKRLALPKTLQSWLHRWSGEEGSNTDLI